MSQHTLTFSITAAEAKTHFEARAKHYAARAAMYQQQVEALQKSISEADAIASAALKDAAGKLPSSLSYGTAGQDPLSTLKDRRSRNQTKSYEFAFYAEHLPQGEIFRLDAEALARFEFGKTAPRDEDDE